MAASSIDSIVCVVSSLCGINLVLMCVSFGEVQSWIERDMRKERELQHDTRTRASTQLPQPQCAGCDNILTTPPSPPPRFCSNGISILPHSRQPRSISGDRYQQAQRNTRVRSPRPLPARHIRPLKQVKIALPKSMYSTLLFRRPCRSGQRDGV